jgi:hypothetical protein
LHTGEIKPGELKAELRSYVGAATVLPWSDPKFWPRLRYSLPPASPDQLAMSQSTTLHSLQSYPSSTQYQDPHLHHHHLSSNNSAGYQDPELYAVGPRYQSNPRAALLYSPLKASVSGGTRPAAGTLYTLQAARGGGGSGQTYYATSTNNSRGGAGISHIYQVVE